MTISTDQKKLNDLVIELQNKNPLPDHFKNNLSLPSRTSPVRTFSCSIVQKSLYPIPDDRNKTKPLFKVAN